MVATCLVEANTPAKIGVGARHRRIDQQYRRDTEVADRGYDARS
jgi:hypothetical protein